MRIFDYAFYVERLKGFLFETICEARGYSFRRRKFRNRLHDALAEFSRRPAISAVDDSEPDSYSANPDAVPYGRDALDGRAGGLDGPARGDWECTD